MASERPFLVISLHEQVEVLVARWLSFEELSMYDACRDNPELAWQAIQEVLTHDLSEEQMASLAAGPVENLLSFAGNHFIDRVEQTARENPKFQYVLKGIWKRLMEEEIWKRIEALQVEEMAQEAL